MWPEPIRKARAAAHALGELIWPRVCLLCDGPMPPEPSAVCFCPKCQNELTTDGLATCPRCASSIGPHVPRTGDCTRCRNETYSFASAQRLGVYDGPLREAILKIKQPGQEILAESLGLLWGEFARKTILQSSPHVLVPVPLHWRKRWERGFNQAEALARGLGLVLKIPVLTWAVRRVRATPEQTSQTPSERRRNVQGAFRSTKFTNVRDVRVLLIDDVLTTGATADAVSGALRDAGAAQVDVAVLAHR